MRSPGRAGLYMEEINPHSALPKIRKLQDKVQDF